MMLVRARPKAKSEWPDWAKCCDELPDQTEIVVDLDDIGNDTIAICRHCRRELKTPSQPAARIVSGPMTGWRTPLALLDLDEGPLETA